MYRNILVATDGSDLATRAAKQAIGLAKSVAAKLTAVTVTEPFHWFAPNMVREAEAAYLKGTGETAERALGVVADAAHAAGVPCDTIHVQDQHPFKGIIDTAQSRGCDLIVMASHGRSGVSAIVLGSETVKVLTHSSIPVLVYR